jgi:hypothetical protein
MGYPLYIFEFCHMLIFGSWYVFLVLLYVINTCFIGGQHIIINCHILFILFFSIYLFNFLPYFH